MDDVKTLGYNPTPSVIIIDNEEIADIFNQAQVDNLTLGATLKKINAKRNENFLFLTNQDQSLISLEYEYMGNSSPKLSIQLLETSEYFETRLLRSVTEVVRLEKMLKKREYSSRISDPPFSRFFIAFGVGDNLQYWSPLNSFFLIGAEAFSDFGEAKTVTLSFTTSFSLQEFNFNALESFISRDLLINGQLVLKERVPLVPYDVALEFMGTDYGTDYVKYSLEKEINAPLLSTYGINRNISFRTDNIPWLLRPIENIIDRALQLIFNTDNVLIVCPTDYQNFPYLQQEIESYASKNDISGSAIDTNPANFFDPTKLVRQSWRKDSIAVNIDETGVSDAEWNSVLAGYQDLINDGLDLFGIDNWQAGRPEDFMRVTALFTILSDMYALFGLNFGYSDFILPYQKSGSEKPPINLLRVQPNVGAGRIAHKRQEYNSVNFINNISNIGVTLNTGRFTVDNNVRVLEDLVQTLINGYVKLTAIDNFTLIRESNLDILASLDEDIKNGLGYSLFDKTKPLLIFGDLGNISRTIYGVSTRQPTTTVFANLIKTKMTTSKRLNQVANLYNSRSNLAEVMNTSDVRLDRWGIPVDLSKDPTVGVERYANELQLPIFKYNTPINPNVISVTINDNKAYYVMLAQSYQVIQDYTSLKNSIYVDPVGAADTLFEREFKLLQERQAILGQSISNSSGLDEKGSEANKALTEEFVAISERYKLLRKQAYLLDFYNMSVDKQKEFLLKNASTDPTGGDKNKIVVDSSEKDAQDYITGNRLAFMSGDAVVTVKDKIERELEAFKEFVSVRSGLITIVEDGYAKDPMKFYVDQINYLDQITFQVEIETLPFFPISSPLFMFTPCLLFAIRPRLTGSTNLMNYVDTISGSYNILGFYHKIDSGGAFSRFKLFSVPENQRAQI